MQVRADRPVAKLRGRMKHIEHVRLSAARAKPCVSVSRKLLEVHVPRKSLLQLHFRVPVERISEFHLLVARRLQRICM